MEIQKLSLRELNHDELINIYGGCQLGDAFRSAWNAICGAAKWIWDKSVELYYKLQIEYR